MGLSKFFTLTLCTSTVGFAAVHKKQKVLRSNVTALQTPAATPTAIPAATVGPDPCVANQKLATGVDSCTCAWTNKQSEEISEVCNAERPWCNKLYPKEKDANGDPIPGTQVLTEPLQNAGCARGMLNQKIINGDNATKRNNAEENQKTNLKTGPCECVNQFDSDTKNKIGTYNKWNYAGSESSEGTCFDYSLDKMYGQTNQVPNYGEYCAAFDVEISKKCDTLPKKDWCYQAWCYVRPQFDTSTYTGGSLDKTTPYREQQVVDDITLSTGETQQELLDLRTYCNNIDDVQLSGSGIWTGDGFTNGAVNPMKYGNLFFSYNFCSAHDIQNPDKTVVGTKYPANDQQGKCATDPTYPAADTGTTLKEKKAESGSAKDEGFFKKMFR